MPWNGRTLINVLKAFKNLIVVWIIPVYLQVLLSYPGTALLF